MSAICGSYTLPFKPQFWRSPGPLQSNFRPFFNAYVPELLGVFWCYYFPLPLKPLSFTSTTTLCFSLSVSSFASLPVSSGTIIKVLPQVSPAPLSLYTFSHHPFPPPEFELDLYTVALSLFYHFSRSVAPSALIQAVWLSGMFIPSTLLA